MEDKLVSLETAKLAKKKEFNEICQYYYEILDKPITLQKMSCSNAEGYKQPTAPTQSLLQKWLREKYSIYAESRYNETFNYFEDYVFYNNNYPKPTCIQKDVHSTYEIGLEFALIEALNLIDSDLVIDNEG